MNSVKIMTVALIRAIRATFLLAGIACMPGAAQMLVDEGQLRPELRQFQSGPDEVTLQCSVQPVRPMLNFGFRFQSGYVARVPMRQYEGAGHAWATLIRVTPRDGDRKPSYLVTMQRLPKIPKNNVTFEVAGGFVLGEGKYDIDWTLIDDANRICRDKWTVEAKRSRSERAVPLAIEAGTVDDVSLSRSREARNDPPASADAPRMTVLMHVAPMFPGRTRLRAYDRVLLLSSLSSLLERVPASQVRVIAFNLDQQRELYRNDNFDNAAFRALARRMSDIELGVVDYGVLKNREGHIDLLADLVKDELRASPRSDIVVVMGPTARQSEKVPKSLLEEMKSTEPQFVYFQYKPYQFRSPDFPDTIAFAMKRIGGRTEIIRTPADFGKAIQEVAEVVSPTPDGNRSRR